MDKVKVGFVGAGGLAMGNHYPSLAEFPDAEIAAISELNEQRMRTAAEKYRVSATFSDYRKMIEQAPLDAVYVIMPPHHLFDIVAFCLEQKKHVFIEKPPGVYAYQTRELANLAEKKGCKTMVAFNRRFIPLMRQCRKLVEERGPIIQCMATFVKNHLNGGPYYKGAVDILTCDAIHAVDAMRWMGGEPKAVASDVNSFCMDLPNSFNALIKFQGGASGFLVTNWAVGARRHTFEMHAKGISAYIDPDDKALIFKDNKAEPQVLTANDAAGATQKFKSYGFFGENRHFIDCLKEGRMPETNFADATRTMELVNRIYGSQI